MQGFEGKRNDGTKTIFKIKNMNIIHCICDDKFIKGAMELFNEDRRHKNTYAFIKNKKRIFKARYLSAEDILILDEREFLQCVSNYDVVILHNWFTLREQIICKIPRICKIVWLAWGFDLYNPRNPMIPIQIYGKDTLEFEKQQNSIPIWITNLLNSYRARYRQKALSRVDFFSGVYPYEYDLLKKYKKVFRAKPLDFYYGSMQFFIKDEIDTHIDNKKKNVIIGNSADPTNNHYEALTQLLKISLDKDSKIIIPLSYGGNIKYKEWIKGYANKLYPNSINALDNYLPLHEYLQLVSNCKYAIYAHKRQQASDNILMQILYGANVFLSEDSFAFNHFKELGLKIFSLESDLNDNFQGLTDDDILLNRKILAQYYGQTSLLKRVLLMNDIVQNKKIIDT